MRAGIGFALMLIFAAACQKQAPESSPPPSASMESLPVTVFYACDTLDVRVTIHGDTADVVTPTASYHLPHVVSASGARYSDGVVTFWSQGDSAMLEVPGAVYHDCRIKP